MNSGLIAQLQGLRDDPVPPFNGGGGIGFAQVFQMLLALVVVLFIVKWVAAKYLTKFAKTGAAKSSGELKIEQAATVSGGQILLMTVRGRTLLVGVGASGFATLADLTEEDTSDDSPTPKSEADFDKVLNRLKRLQG